MRRENYICMLAVACCLVIASVVQAQNAGMPDASGSQAAIQAEPSAKAFVPEREFAFGLVKPDQVVEHDFLVFNNGDAELLIPEVKPG